jgi:hypothetical protein
VGKPERVRVAFQALQGPEGAMAIGLRVQARKCAVTCGQREDAAALAASLNVTHSPYGITACGTPIGTDAYIKEAVASTAASVVAQVNKLMTLPLAKQSQFVLLRASLAVRMNHLLRTVPWEQVCESMGAVETAIQSAVAAIFRLPAAADPTSVLVAPQPKLQIKLPLRHGGFGLRTITSIEAEAALLSGAAMAQANLVEGLPECRPFDGLMRPTLLAAWHRVFADAGEECGWGPLTRDLPSDFVTETLPSVQSSVSRCVGDRDGAVFFASFDADTEEGRRGKARMLSVANGPALAWATAVPGASTTRLSNEHFIIAGRHTLGLGVPLQVEVHPCLCGTGNAGRPDHAMACTQTRGTATLRHDLLASAWRRAIRRAGCATSAEPAYSSLAARHSGDPGLRRGDILAVMPGGRIAVLDCVVTHPAASSYLPGASRTAGFAAARAERLKHADFEQFGSGAGYEFVPLAMESYGRLGRDASRFLSELGDIAASDGRVRKGAFVRSVRQELSCALCRGNSAMYFQSTFSIAQAVGRQFMPGCDCPVDESGEV